METAGARREAAPFSRLPPPRRISILTDDKGFCLMTVPASGDFIKRLNQLSKDADTLRKHLGDSADALARDHAERADEIDTLANSIARSLEFIRREGQTMAMQIQQLHGLTET